MAQNAATGTQTTEVDIDARLARIEGAMAEIASQLAELVKAGQVQDYYDIEEFARLVGKAPFTCREWARKKRVRAEKRRSGHGRYAAWVVSHDELLRYRREGLLPDPHISRISA